MGDRRMVGFVGMGCVWEGVWWDGWILDRERQDIGHRTWDMTHRGTWDHEIMIQMTMEMTHDT